MGYRPIVHCRQCNEALDVYMADFERFCSEECLNKFSSDYPGVIERELAAERKADEMASLYPND